MTWKLDSWKGSNALRHYRVETLESGGVVCRLIDKSGPKARIITGEGETNEQATGRAIERWLSPESYAVNHGGRWTLYEIPGPGGLEQIPGRGDARRRLLELEGGSGEYSVVRERAAS
jgi:hypothetical protein